MALIFWLGNLENLIKHKIMKTISILHFLLILGTANIYCQTTSVKSEVAVNTQVITNPKISRFSYILGAGTSFIPSTNYENPSVNLTNNNVIIQKSQSIKTNVTFGITYTPFFNKNIPDGEGGHETVPRGITFATFINPLTITKAINTQEGLSATDFGVGIGYKFAGNVMIMGTVEWFGARQPKQYFLQEYINGDKQYIVNNDTQLSFDPKDDNIFYTKIITSFGFKLCYTFDIIKKFKTN